MLKLEQQEQQYLQALELMDVAEDELEIAALQRDRLLEQIEELKRKQQELSSLLSIDAGAASKISPTDPDARLMKGRCGKHFSYNVQAATDTVNYMIAALQVQNQQNDKGLLSAGVEMLHQWQGFYPKEVLADAGFHLNTQTDRRAPSAKKY